MMTLVDDGQKVTFDGIPVKFIGLVEQYSREEILKDTMFILNNVFKVSEDAS